MFLVDPAVPGVTGIGLSKRATWPRIRQREGCNPTPAQLAIYTQLAYTLTMQAVFVELPAFERHRGEYLDDETFRLLQDYLMQRPNAGDVIQGAGGLRKLRFADPRRGKGKRGGLRVIYYLWIAGTQFWLFTIYDKDEADDLTAKERKELKALLDRELKARSI
jgi:hypothetical protein